MKILMNNNDIKRSIKRISYEIIEKNHGVENLVVLGIKNGGVALAKMIADNLTSIEKTNVPVSHIDITPFRDDNEIDHSTQMEELNIDINGKTVVIVDDVLYTGRTIRAALDYLFHHGRPEKIELATLVDRGHRQLPIRADFVGKNIPTSTKETVNAIINDEESFVEIR